MRRLMRFASAGLAVSLALAPVASAQASPLSERQWWFDSRAIEELVWPKTKGAGVTVAVIDSGVQADLPDLRDAVLPGTDMTGGGSDGRRDTQDGAGDFGHGTAMASLIASRGTKTGFTGLAPRAKILPIVAPGVGSTTTAPAIRYAADHGAKVISISQGSPAGSYPHQCPPAVLEAVKHAAEKDAIVVAAAGNEGDSTNEPSYPASCPGVVAVGAFDNQGQAWEHTQRQDYVTLSAPGVNITALGRDGQIWVNGEGTGHATALASGCFALLRSAFPDKSAREIVRLAVNTAKDLGPSGKDDQFGYGALSLRNALSQSVPAGAPNPVYERLDKALAQNANGSSTTSAPQAATAAKKSGGNVIYGGAVFLLGVAMVIAYLYMRHYHGRRTPLRPPRPPKTPTPPPGYGPPGSGPSHNVPPPPPAGGYAPPPPYGHGPTPGPQGPPPGGHPPQR